MGICAGCGYPVDCDGDAYVCDCCDDVFCAECLREGIIKYVDGRGWVCVECRAEAYV